MIDWERTRVRPVTTMQGRPLSAWALPMICSTRLATWGSWWVCGGRRSACAKQRRQRHLGKSTLLRMALARHSSVPAAQAGQLAALVVLSPRSHAARQRLARRRGDPFAAAGGEWTSPDQAAPLLLLDVTRLMLEVFGVQPAVA
jgi:hypothetical protein